MMSAAYIIETNALNCSYSKLFRYSEAILVYM